MPLSLHLGNEFLYWVSYDIFWVDSIQVQLNLVSAMEAIDEQEGCSKDNNSSKYSKLVVSDLGIVIWKFFRWGCES